MRTVILLSACALSIPSIACSEPASCTGCVSSTQYGHTRTDFEVVGHRGFVIMPSSRPKTGLIPWVWYAPTFIGSLPGNANTWICERLLAKGIAVCGVEVGESFGNPQGRAVFTEFHRSVVSQFGLSAKACLWPQSRGGLMLYNWAVEHPGFVRCIGGTYTVCDIASFPGVAAAAPAYGMSEAELRSHLATHNPIDRLAPLAAHKIPILHIHGDNDTLVPLEANSAELARRYRALGGSMELIIVNGKGHEEIPEYFERQEMVDFFVSNASK